MPKYVTLKNLRPLGWSVTLVFVGAAGWSYHDGAHWPAGVFIALSLLGVYLLFGSVSRYAVDAETLTAITPLGWHYRMLWSEVLFVEVGTGGTMVFHGINKRFVLPPVSFWHGENRSTMFQLLIHQLEARKLTPTLRSTADYRWNKNVRIKIAA